MRDCCANDSQWLVFVNCVIHSDRLEASFALWEVHAYKPSTNVLTPLKLGALREVARDNIFACLFQICWSACWYLGKNKKSERNFLTSSPYLIKYSTKQHSSVSRCCCQGKATSRGWSTSRLFHCHPFPLLCSFFSLFFVFCFTFKTVNLNVQLLY